MNKNYLIVGIVLVLIIVGGIYFSNSSVKMANQSGNICEQVVSFNDVKSICVPSFSIREAVDESYYVVPNDNNTRINDWGNQLDVFVENGTRQISLTIFNGTKSVCEKDVNNGVSPYSFSEFNSTSDSRYLTVQVYEYNSSEFAKEAYGLFNPDFNYTNESGVMNPEVYEKGNSIGENFSLLAFAGGKIFDKTNNLTADAVKSTSLQFLRENKIVTITAISYLSDKDLICNVSQIKELASIIDKRI